MSYTKWESVGCIDSDRAARTTTRLQAVVVDKVTGEVLESTVFTPGKDRLAASQWPKDYADHINKKLKLARAGTFGTDGLSTVESTSKNELWAAPGVRVIAAHLRVKYWEEIGRIIGSRDLVAGDVVTVKVCSRHTDKLYEVLVFTPVSLSSMVWTLELADHINKHSLFIGAGKTREVNDKVPPGSVDGLLFIPTPLVNANPIWAPTGSELSVSVQIEKWTAAGSIPSDRGALAGRRLTAVVIDSASDEIVESLTCTPPEASRAYADWPKYFAEQINKGMKRVRAGQYDSKVSGPVASSTANRLWLAEPGLRVFTTALHPDAWESVATIAGDALNLKSVVTVQACSALTGKVYETLNFTPDKDRLASEKWTQDLAKHINARSLYLRAGRAWGKDEWPAKTIQAASNDTDICYPSAGGTNLIWVVKGSGMSVRISIDTLQKVKMGIDSDRAALDGRPITLVVIDSESEEILETIGFTPDRDRLGYLKWPKDCAEHFNKHSRWVRVGQHDKDTGITGRESTYENYLWLPPGVRAFVTGCWRSEYWEEIGSLRGGNLGTDAVVSVRVSSRITGQVYETLSFTPSKSRLASYQWCQDLARHINKHSLFLRAGRVWKDQEINPERMKTEGKELFFPTGGSNLLWAPRGSLLAVEVVGDFYQQETPAPAVPYYVEVDDFSGVYSCKVPLGTVIGNGGIGPVFDVVLDVSKTKAELNVTSVVIISHGNWMKGTVSRKIILRTASGVFHSIETSSDNNEVFNLGDVNLFADDEGVVVEHRDGHREYMRSCRNFLEVENSEEYRIDNFYLPARIEKNSGIGLNFEWGKSEYSQGASIDDPDVFEAFGAPMMAPLLSIKDDMQVLLVKGEFTNTTAVLTVHADRDDMKLVCSLDFNVSNVERHYIDNVLGKTNISFSSATLNSAGFVCANKGWLGLEFLYSKKNLSEIRSSASSDHLTCDSSGRVLKHMTLSTGRVDKTVSYSYDAKARTTQRITECSSSKVTEEFHYEKTANRLIKHVIKNAKTELNKAYTYTLDSKSGVVMVTLQTTYVHGSKTRSVSVTMTLDKHGNLIKREQDGFITEWTYYRGDPEVREKKISSKRVEKQTSGTGLVVGWAIDYANPVGWLNSLFNDKGLTWGTDYEIEKYLSVRKTEHGKSAFGLPIDLKYPGDMQFFTRYVESERVYTMKGDTRVDLNWTFYSYSELKHFKGDDKPTSMVLHKKIVVQDPVSADHKKIDRHAGAEVQTYTWHADRNNPKCYGELGILETALYDSSGKQISGSDHKEEYFIEVNNSEKSTFNYSNVTISKVTRDGVMAMEVRDRSSGKIRREYNHGVGPDKHFEYDALGRIKLMKLLNRSGADTLQQYTYGYFRCGANDHEVVSSGEQRMRNVHDSSGKFIQHQVLISDAAGWRTLQSYDYDSWGRQTEVVEFDYHPDGRFLSRCRTTITYDDWGKPNVTSTNGTKRRRHYCPIDMRLTEWTVNAADKLIGAKVETQYNANGTPASVIVKDVKGAQLHKSSLEYNSKTQVSKLTSSTLGATSFTYDAFGRTTQVEQHGVKFTNAYPAHSLAPVASSASMEWIDRGSKRSFTLGEQTVDRYGRVSEYRRGTLKQQYEYKGAAKRLGTAVREADALEMHRPESEFYDLDETTLRISESFAGQASGRHLCTSSYYSLQGRLLQVADAFGHMTHYHYTADGRYRAQANAQMNSQVTRDEFGLISEERTKTTATSHVVTIAYTHDTLGRETERRIKVNGFDDLSIQRTYDSNGRLQRSLTQQGSKNTLIRDERYEYGTSGVLLKYGCSGSQRSETSGLGLEEQLFEHDSARGVSKVTSTVTKLAYSTNTLINTCTYGSSGISAEPLSGLSSKREGRSKGYVASFSNDSAGRMCRFSTTYDGEAREEFELAYSANGRLHEIKDVINDRTTAYSYDTYGKLVGRKDGDYTVDLLYQHGIPYAQIRQKHADSSTQYLMLLNHSQACELQRVDTIKASKTVGSGYSLQIKDAHGSIVASYDLATKSVRFLGYTPYGERTTSRDDLCWRGFNGEVLDPECLGIYHLGHGHRVYSPWMMRFTSGDRESPFSVGGPNAYGLCSGDPVNLCDPSGRQAIGRYTHSESAYFADPLVEAIVTGVIGIVMGGIGGVSAFGALGGIVAVGLGATSTGLGIGALYVVEKNSDLAGAMAMLAFAIDFDGTFGSVHSGPVGRGAGIRAGGQLGLPVDSNMVRTGTKPGGVRSHTFKNSAGDDLFVLYTHPKNKRLLIDGHGDNLVGAQYMDGSKPPRTFSTQVTPEIAFYADEGFTMKFPAGKSYEHLLDGKVTAKNFYQKNYPNYMLSELTDEFLARERGTSITDAKRLRKEIFDYVRKGKSDVDYLTPLTNVTLDRVFEILQREGFSYEMVSGLHCRGPLRERLGTALERNTMKRWYLMANRNYGLHPIVVD